ncbi:gustatory receptor 68a [Plutella xylostella]|uniref:gustatory receptor 68a n=1 Tax=Plutella xylostella TaxID=51655 RepID=UPI0020323E3E|nr:gustatory receptor 68a [Plutella xylostella]
MSEIKDLALAYNIIGELYLKINQVFNFIMLIGVIGAFSYVVITIWATLYYHRLGGPIYASMSLLSTTVWVVNESVSTFIICIVCDWFSSSRKVTRSLLAEIIIDYEQATSVRAAAKSFMELVSAWPLQMIVYDMFQVDISLILKFVSTCTTYLIIMLQFIHFV